MNTIRNILLKGLWFWVTVPPSARPRGGWCKSSWVWDLSLWVFLPCGAHVKKYIDRSLELKFRVSLFSQEQKKASSHFGPSLGRGDFQFYEYRKSVPETNFNFQFFWNMKCVRATIFEERWICPEVIYWQLWRWKFDLFSSIFNYCYSIMVRGILINFHGNITAMPSHSIAQQCKVKFASICILQYKFFHWKWPPPHFGTFPQSHLVWYYHPSLSITCIYYVDFVASVTRSACVKSTRKAILFLAG